MVTDFAKLITGTEHDDVINWNYSSLNINLGAGNDRVETGNFDNVIEGGKGNDSFYTGTGNDVFVFHRGDGHDVINDKGGNDTVIFGEGITKEDIIASRDGYTLCIGIKNSNGEIEDTIRVEGYFAPVNNGGDIKSRYLAVSNIIMNFKGVKYYESLDKVVIIDKDIFIPPQRNCFK